MVYGKACGDYPVIIGASKTDPRLWREGIVAYDISFIQSNIQSTKIACSPKDVLFGLIELKLVSKAPE